MIEAMLLLLPVPDPKDAKEKLTEMGNKAMTMVKGNNNNTDMNVGQYTSNFDAPGTLKNSDDEEEDDEEDIGRDIGQNKKDLDYDSDPMDGNADDGANAELISLDSGKNQKKSVPKLRKPQ